MTVSLAFYVCLWTFKTVNILYSENETLILSTIFISYFCSLMPQSPPPQALSPLWSLSKIQPPLLGTRANRPRSGLKYVLRSFQGIRPGEVFGKIFFTEQAYRELMFWWIAFWQMDFQQIDWEPVNNSVLLYIRPPPTYVPWSQKWVHWQSHAFTVWTSQELPGLET